MTGRDWPIDPEVLAKVAEIAARDNEWRDAVGKPQLIQPFSLDQRTGRTVQRIHPAWAAGGISSRA